MFLSDCWITSTSKESNIKTTQSIKSSKSSFEEDTTPSEKEKEKTCKELRPFFFKSDSFYLLTTSVL
jgi:hypothetical protein